MRLNVVLIGIASVILAVAGPSAGAQLSRPGDLDPSGRVLVKIKIAMTDEGGFGQAVSGVRLLVVSETGDGSSINTDDAGNATAWLKPGSYRVVTPDTVTWAGAAYTWDMIVRVEAGMGLVSFSQTNATPAAGKAAAANPPEAVGAPGQPGRSRLRVFVDCQTDGCDMDYFRSEIPFVDYMRDRADASVHMLVTSESTGGGGRSYTVNFIGQRELAGLVDTMHYVVTQTATDDQKRSGLARTLKLGLVRYAVRTPEGDRLRLSYAAPGRGSGDPVGPATDPWNLWVFRTTASGSFGGEKSQRYLSLRGTSSVNRTSESWKFRLGFNGGYDESTFTLSDGSEYGDYTRFYGANHLLVRSVGGHWAIGERASLSSSTFLNQKLVLRFAPTIEFNFFPYSQSTRRRFTVAYAVGVNSFTYEDTTLFEKLEEVRPYQSTTISLDFKQPWGSTSLTLEGAALLDDFSKNHATLFSELEVRLFKGFSFNTYAGLSRIRDQLYLAKGKLTDEEILLRRKRLASKYSYEGGLGFSYTFGSIFNNVVNTRFDEIR